MLTDQRKKEIDQRLQEIEGQFYKVPIQVLPLMGKPYTARTKNSANYDKNKDREWYRRTALKRKANRKYQRPKNLELF